MELDNETKIGSISAFCYRYRVYLGIASLLIACVVIWQFFPEITIPDIGLQPQVKAKSLSSSTEKQLPDKQSDLSLYVDVSGEVERPGVYQVSSSARVSDVIKLSGGLSKNADLRWVQRNLNFALRLSDGDKIYIPYKGEIVDTVSQISASAGIVRAEDSIALAEGNILGKSTVKSTSFSTIGSSQNDGKNASSNVSSGASSTKTGGKINVNSASLSELDTLPGIGPVTADKIIKSRPYKDLKDLISKTKLKTSVAESIKNLVSY